MRLGFSVAAFLEPDILLVDEVLAVGDAAFQQKCLERMREVLDQGTTLVFVSHDLAAMEAACSRGRVAPGRRRGDEPARSGPCLSAYRSAIEEAAEGDWDRSRPCAHREGRDHGPRHARCCHRRSGHRRPRDRVHPGVPAADVFIGVSEGPATPIFLVRQTTCRCATATPRSGASSRACPWPTAASTSGRASPSGGSDLVPWHPCGTFNVQGPVLDVAPRAVVRLSPVHVTADWHVLD